MNSYVNYRLDSIINTLKQAVDVCYLAPDNENEGYPFATGYSRSAMQTAIQDLQDLSGILKELHTNS